jgi:hypothetical protein
LFPVFLLFSSSAARKRGRAELSDNLRGAPDDQLINPGNSAKASAAQGGLPV